MKNSLIFSWSRSGGVFYYFYMDLEKFFDTVNQSKFIEILSRKGGL